ncbi:MAG: TonB family protein [Thermoanaerobaculia bacterium]
MHNRLLPVSLALLLAACAGSTPPAPVADEVATTVEPEAPPAPIGMIRVTASRLNVRSGPSTKHEIIGSARRGERLALLERGDGWVRVLLTSGTIGWVSATYARDVRNCLPDREFSIVQAPMMSFSDSGAHGTVVVDATVSADGKVTKTNILSNSTGDEALAILAEREIRQAVFDPPVRNCLPRTFIYTYRRTY